MIYYSLKDGDIMKLYCFLKEYQGKNKYDNLMKKITLWSIVPLVSMVLLRTFKCNLIFSILFPFIIYVGICLIFIFKKRGECRGNEYNFIKELLIKYDYYSEKKINYLIKLCEENIQKENDKSRKIVSFLSFILPFIISIIALFQFDNITKQAVLIFLFICAVIIYLGYQVAKYFIEYIRACSNQMKIDYDGLKDELYDILLKEEFHGSSLFSYIKKRFLK